jgi:hypothetical protein
MQTYRDLTSDTRCSQLPSLDGDAALEYISEEAQQFQTLFHMLATNSYFRDLSMNYKYLLISYKS